MRRPTPVARVLIDALGADSPGARRHLEGFLPALRKQAGDRQFRLIVRRSAADALRALAGGALDLWPISNGISQPYLLRLAVDLLYVPLHASRHGFDAIVTLANFGPVWTPVPHIVFQRNAMHFSQEYLGRIGGLLRLEWRLRGWLSVAEMRFATVTVTPTDAMADLIRQTHPSLAGKRFHTLPHGVDLTRFAAVETGPPEPPFVFLYPTKIEPYKGLEILLEATRRLASDRDGFEVHVTAADHGWPREIQDRIEAGRGQAWFERVRFTGAQPADRMPQVYGSSHAILYTSLCESFGFPLLESMACGLPIVAGDLGVNREVCGNAATYYEASSAEACAARMRALLDDATRRDALRAAGLARIAKLDWSWSRYARRFVELCDTVTAGT